MTSCIRCRTKFDEAEAICPSCGTPATTYQLEPASARRCGPWGMRFLTFAWVMAFLAGIFSAIVGLIAIANGNHWNGLLALFVGSPVAFGHHVALGLAMNYAERRP